MLGVSSNHQSSPPLFFIPPQAFGKPKMASPNHTTVAIYFPDKKELARIKRAAKSLGMPFTALIRQGARTYAAEVLKSGRAKALRAA